LSKYALLIVDDLLVQTTVEESAKALGIACERARSGEDALRRAGANPPAVIILDCTAEKLRPLAILRRLKDEKHPAHRTPVIGFVAHAQTDLQTKIHDLGCEFVYPRSALIHQAASILRQLALDTL
jgi:CheY-like chemotaxis protein